MPGDRGSLPDNLSWESACVGIHHVPAGRHVYVRISASSGRNIRVWIFRRRRLRRIERRLIQPRFKFLDLSQHNTDNRLSFRRLSSNQFIRDLKRHSRVVAHQRAQGQVSLIHFYDQALNGYVEMTQSGIGRFETTNRKQPISTICRIQREIRWHQNMSASE